MLKINTILSETFLNAVQSAYTLHAELNRPAENRSQPSRAWCPIAHVGNVHRYRHWNTILTARTACTCDRVFNLYRVVNSLNWLNSVEFYKWHDFSRFSFLKQKNINWPCCKYFKTCFNFVTQALGFSCWRVYFRFRYKSLCRNVENAIVNRLFSPIYIEQFKIIFTVETVLAWKVNDSTNVV